MTRVAPTGGAVPGRIGRYEVLERIGKGAMGVVYSARDEVMDRQVAVKVMMTDLEAEPETRTRFYREAQAAGRLLHPNIITILDMGEDEGRIYIVMELLKGLTLAEHLRQSGIPLEQKVGLMVQTCEGLAAAHASGIVHRDIKPGNLFVLHDGTLKILDFGVARLATSTMTASGFIIGTPDYMSPEQARGKEIDARSDVFSAAGVFYYMLTGSKPFAAHDLPTVLRKVQSEMPPPVPESAAPPALARVVMRSLAKDPALRHQSMLELAADLNRFRRHYEAETRQTAVAARASFDAIEDLVRTREAHAERLGLPPFDDPPAAARLRRDYPAFVERGPEELLLVPFTRVQADELAASLAAEREALARQAAPLDLAGSAFAAAETALAVGRPEDAASRLEEAAGQLPDTEPVRDLRTRCAAAVAEYRERRARLEALAADARAAADAENWSTVLALSDDALALDPAAAELSALRERARAALEREARERRRLQQAALDRARRATADRRFDAADRALDEAGHAGAPPDEVGPIAELLAQARDAAAAEAALANQAAEVISLARAEFHAGHRREALAVLRDCLASEPSAPGVRPELDHLQSEVARLDEIDRRHALAEEHVARASAALRDGNPETAAREASAALTAEAGHAEAARIGARAQALLRAEAEARARKARAREHVARAENLLEAGSIAKAAREAQHALESEADNAEAAALLERIRRRQVEEEAARERVRILQHELKAARQALRAGDCAEADAAVQRALAAAPDTPAAIQLRQEIEAERGRLERLRLEKEDETVAVAPGGHAQRDSDDTVNQALVAGGATSLIRRLGDRLRNLLRRR